METSDEIEGDRPPVLPRSDTVPSKLESSRAGRLLSNASGTFAESRLPVGMFAAFGAAGSNVPTLKDIETGNFNSQGWSAPAQRRNSQARRMSLSEISPAMPLQKSTLEVVMEPQPGPAIHEAKPQEDVKILPVIVESSSFTGHHDPNVPYPNGYQFPPKHTFAQSLSITLRAFSKWVITPLGFLLTIYALNIVAWGGMLFLILIRATPAMSHPSWNSWQSGAKTWLEIDSQILNALFCVTGLGLAPWRFRDLYYLMKWRIKKDEGGLRRLAGIHRDWFRLQGSDMIDPLYNPTEDSLPPEVDQSSLAYPVALSPSAPLTGERASPSLQWKLDFVIWAFVWNTLLQCVLCGLMWGMNKYNRPSWSVGLFISLACIIASAGGWIIFQEGKRVKRVEGVRVSEEDRMILERMRENEKSQIV